MSRWLRTRGLVDRWFGVFVVAFLVVALAGGWLAYQGHVDPGTTTEQRTVSTWNTTGSITHSATVTAATPIYDIGQTLHDRHIYLRGASPVLNGTVSFVYGASDDGTLDVDMTRRVVLRSVEDTRERTVEVWHRTYQVDSRSVDSLDPGSTVRIPFSVNVSRMMNASGRVDEQLDSPPGQPRLVVNTTVAFSGTVNGRPVERTEVYPLLVEFEGSAYRVTANAPTEQFETTRTVEVPRDPGRVALVGGPLFLLVGLAGVGGLVAARHQDLIGLTEAERERLEYEDDREDFEEWIVSIRLPNEVFDRPQARADSLGSLVDFAIDTDNGVIEDRSRGLYCVLHDGTLYTYQPPSGLDGADTTPPGLGSAGTADDASDGESGAETTAQEA